MLKGSLRKCFSHHHLPRHTAICVFMIAYRESRLLLVLMLLCYAFRNVSLSFFFFFLPSCSPPFLCAELPFTHTKTVSKTKTDTVSRMGNLVFQSHIIHCQDIYDVVIQRMQSKTAGFMPGNCNLSFSFLLLIVAMLTFGSTFRLFQCHINSAILSCIHSVN